MHIGHEPALPADGLHQRDAFIAHMESENAAFAASLPDMGYESLIETSGDEITATTTISGTMADGTKVRATIPVTYTIGSGEIVRLMTVVDAATVATML